MRVGSRGACYTKCSLPDMRQFLVVSGFSAFTLNYHFTVTDQNVYMLICFVWQPTFFSDAGT